METASYLCMLSKGPSYIKEDDLSLDSDYARTLDEPVANYLNIYDSSKRAMHLYLAGLTHLVYAENSTSSLQADWLYSKVKLLKKRALNCLVSSQQLDPYNPYCQYSLALCHALEHRVDQALAVLPTGDLPLAVPLNAILLLCQSRLQEAY